MAPASAQSETADQTPVESKPADKACNTQKQRQQQQQQHLTLTAIHQVARPVPTEAKSQRLVGAEKVGYSEPLLSFFRLC
jgi:hypothetical protein